MEKSSKIIKNTIYLYIKSFVSMFVMLFVTRIVLQTLGVVDYGIYNVVAGSIAILGFFRNSLAVTMQRFLNHFQGEGDFLKQIQVFNIGIVYHWIAATILVILFIILGFFLYDGILNIPDERISASKIVYLSLIVNTFITVITAPYDATITAHENMLFYSVVGIAESLGKLFVSFFIIYASGDKLIIYSLLMMGVPLVETLAMRIYCKMKYKECVFHPFQYWNSMLAKEMRKFAGWSLIGSSTNVVSNHGANIALNHFFGASINAVAGIANQIQGILAVLLSGMLKSLTPVIFKFEGEGNKTDMVGATLLGCKYSTLLFSFLAVPVFIQAPYLLGLWLKDVPEWTVLFVRLQLLRTFVEQLGSFMMNLLNATNHVKEINSISFIYNLSPVIILVMLYRYGFPPYWHYIIFILVMSMGQNLVVTILCNRYCDLKYSEYAKIVFFPCCIISSVPLILGFVSNSIYSGFVGLVLCTLIALCSFLLFMYLFMQKTEKRVLHELLKNKIK